jgi:hypothetical protein
MSATSASQGPRARGVRWQLELARYGTAVNELVLKTRVVSTNLSVTTSKAQ